MLDLVLHCSLTKLHNNLAIAFHREFTLINSVLLLQLNTAREFQKGFPESVIDPDTDLKN